MALSLQGRRIQGLLGCIFQVVHQLEQHVYSLSGGVWPQRFLYFCVILLPWRWVPAQLTLTRTLWLWCHITACSFDEL